MEPIQLCTQCHKYKEESVMISVELRCQVLLLLLSNAVIASLPLTTALSIDHCIDVILLVSRWLRQSALPTARPSAILKRHCGEDVKSGSGSGEEPMLRNHDKLIYLHAKCLETSICCGCINPIHTAPTRLPAQPIQSVFSRNRGPI